MFRRDETHRMKKKRILTCTLANRIVFSSFVRYHQPSFVCFAILHLNVILVAFFMLTISIFVGLVCAVWHMLLKSQVSFSSAHIRNVRIFDLARPFA